MTRQDVINNIMANYGKYSIDKAILEEQKKDGEQQGFSYQNIYTGLRMALGNITGERECFSIQEMSEALGASETEILEQVESMLEDAKAAGLNPDDYATKVEPVQRFIIPAGGLTL